MRPLLLLASLLCAAAHAQPDGGVDPPATVDERLDALGGELDAVKEQLLEAKGSVESATRLKFQGYVHAQYVYAENSDTGVDLRGNPAVKDGFSVRRGRLKATYTGTISELMLEVDWTGRAAELRSAEATFIEPWTGEGLAFTVGQIKWPFGHEIFQSSTEREFPERSRVIRSFFAGERDRGARLVWKHGKFKTTAAVVDGNSIQNQGFVGVDNDREKDLSGRVEADFGFIAGGVSALYGKTFVRGLYDVEPARPGHYEPRTRVGADLQLYLQLLPFGGTAIKAEWVMGRSYWSSGVERAGVPAMGWYAMVAQAVGAHEELGVRFDWWDPAMGTPLLLDRSDPTRPASSNPVGTLDLALTHHFDELVKVVASYELVRTAGTRGTDDPDDDLFTLRLQARF